MRVMLSALVLMIMAATETTASPARAAEDVLRYVSLDTTKAFLRTGPGRRYPVSWVYVRHGWPFEVISEYGYWRKVRDIDGTSGWIHQSLLSNRRRTIVTGSVESVYEDPERTAPQVMLVEKGVVADLNECNGNWCRIAVADRDGWIERSHLWGVGDMPPQ